MENNIDNYIINKIDFLKENYGEDTDSNYVMKNVYEVHILKHEMLHDKDCLYFDGEEASNCILNAKARTKSLKERIYSFLNSYYAWGIDKGFINNNPLDIFDKNELTKINPKIVKDLILNFDDFENMLREMELKTSYFNIAIVLLAYYGVTNIDDMCNLTWDCVDAADMKLYIVDENENIKNELPINDLFLDWLEKVKNEEYDMAYKKSDKTEYMPREIDNGYILKVLDNYDSTMIKESSYGVYRRLRKAFNVLDNHPKMTIKQLSNSIKIMYLLNIRKHRVLDSADFKRVFNKYNPNASYSGYLLLIKLYNSLVDDKIIDKFNKEIYETKGEAYNSYMRIIKEIGLENTDMRGLNI